MVGLANGLSSKETGVFKHLIINHWVISGAVIPLKELRKPLLEGYKWEGGQGRNAIRRKYEKGSDSQYLASKKEGKTQL